MNKILYENTKVATYFMWEYTKNENAINLWHCTEDIAYYLYMNEIKTVEDIFEIIKKGKESFEYIYLIRNISYRIYIFSGNTDSASNWYAAERLVLNREWCAAMINIVAEYKTSLENSEILNGLKLESVRRSLFKDK